MITEQEYLKAKAIVEEYEREEYEFRMRQAEEELEEMEPDAGFCEFCSISEMEGHAHGCPNETDPFAILCKEGYD